MHKLKLYTLPTNHDDTFDVHWTNTQMRPRGVIRVRVTARIEDRHIAAELSALKHLLEDKEVLGNKRVGSSDVELVVSLGAIRKLQRRESDKAHLAPYANFLTTRFAGCQLSVDKDKRWFKGTEPETVEHLLVSGPQRERLTVTGIGEVSVTQHVLARYIDRFLPLDEQKDVAHEAWKQLSKLAGDPTVKEVARDGMWTGVNAMNHGRQEGRYFLNRKRNLVLIVANDHRGEQQLVTVYRANQQFRDIPKAA
jgi:hypothetical protein